MNKLISDDTPGMREKRTDSGVHGEVPVHCFRKPAAASAKADEHSRQVDDDKHSYIKNNEPRKHIPKL